MPIDKVSLALHPDLLRKVEAAYLPKGWQSKTDEATNTLTLSSGSEGVPLFEIKARYDIQSRWVPQFKRLFGDEDGDRVKFDFSFGDINYGTRQFEVKKGDPYKVVKPEEAAEIPQFIREGETFSITGREGYRGGVWTSGFDDLMVGAEMVDWHWEDRPRESKAGEEMDRQPSQPTLAQKPSPSQIFRVPEDAPPGAKVNLTYTNEFGQTTVSGAADIKLLPGLTYSSNRPPPPRLFNCTPKIFQGDKICVCGFFPTFFSRLQLLLDGKRLNLPLSSSTDMAVFKPETLAPGKHVITWDVAGFDSLFNPMRSGPKPSAKERVEFLVLTMQASIDRNKLFTGDGTTMRMRIIGTEEKLHIKLLNKTPSIIDLEGGVEQVAITTGGSDNKLERRVKGIHRGNFDIEYSLALPPCPCDPKQTEKAAQLSGDVSNPPENNPGDQTSEAPPICEQILFEYNKLSIVYGKFLSDLRRAHEACDKLDDGTIAGRDRRDACRAQIGLVSIADHAIGPRKRLLDLLSLYRTCIGWSSSGATGY